MEKALMKALFSKYNLKVRPAVSPEERVVVRVGMVLSSFVGLVRHERPSTHIYIHTVNAHPEYNSTVHRMIRNRSDCDLIWFLMLPSNAGVGY